MPLNLVRRGGGVLQSALARPVRIVPQSYIKRISFVARRPLPTAIAAGFPRSCSLIGDLVRSYATGTTAKATKGRPRKNKEKAVKKRATPKRVLTEEEQAKKAEAKKVKQLRQLKAQLKETALQLPKQLPTAVTSLAVSKFYPEAKKTAATSIDAFRKSAEMVRDLSASERQEFENVAKANKAANKAAYEAWVKSHTPRQIIDANTARRRLAQIKGTKRMILIKDDRLVKRPKGAWIHYFEERLVTEEFGGSSAPALASSIAAQYRSLPTADKAKYQQLAKDDLERYRREHLEIYGVPAGTLSAKKKGE
ncbi:hypothetical protein BJX64DRAFT_176607 [Aspergillus heterothallicus]